MPPRPPRKVLLCLISLIATAAAAPACSSGDGYGVMLQATDVFLNQTGGPRLEAYYEADPTLSPEARETYLTELRELRKTIEAAKLGVPPA